MCKQADALLERAEAELSTARREAQVSSDANPAAVCLHAHSSAVHGLRARLALAGQPFPSMPHPVVLLECCLDLEPSWDTFRNDLRMLHLSATDAMDPMAPDLVDMAAASLQAAERFAAAFRLSFNGAEATTP